MASMKLLEELNRAAARDGLALLVIGGHAMNAHGVGRQTADLDLLIPLEDVERWKALLSSLNFRMVRQHQLAFAQFEPQENDQWPIDLVLVDQDTFQKFLDSAAATVLDGVRVRVPCALHLIALKLHALKQAGLVREMQDLPDIVALMKADAIEFDEDFRNFCIRYGNEAIFEQIVRQAGAGKGSG